MALDCADMIERAQSPEEVGVDSSVLSQFFKELKASTYNFKNIMVLRDGKVAAECSHYPYFPEMPGTMFSLSKAITAVAIGFAIDEGLLTIDSPMEEIFKDDFKKGKLKKIEGITVRHLMDMTAGKKLSVLDDKEIGDWLNNFVKAKRFAKPGEKFCYVSDNTYVLSRIISKVSGQSLFEYIKPRFFEPLYIDTNHWDVDSKGYNAGGWGLYLKVEDLARIGICFLQKGVYNGVQVIPVGWTDKMTTPYIDETPSSYAKGLSFGFNTWINKDGSYYRFEGLFGQYIFFYPKHNALVVMNGADIRQDIIFDTIDKYFPLAFKDNLQVPEGQATEAFRKELKQYSYDIIEVAPRQAKTEARVNGNKYRMFPQMFASMLTLSQIFTLPRKTGYMKHVSFNFKEEYGELVWTERCAGENKIVISFDGVRRISEIDFGHQKTHVCAYGKWHNKRKLEIQIFSFEIPEVKTWFVKFDRLDVKIRNFDKTDLGQMFLFELLFQGTKVNSFVKKASRPINAIGNLVANATFMRGIRTKKGSKK